MLAKPSKSSIIVLLGIFAFLTNFPDATGKPLPSMPPFLKAFEHMVRLEPRMSGGCQQYGHSCLGGHGKRDYESQQKAAFQNWLQQLLRKKYEYSNPFEDADTIQMLMDKIDNQK
ncbi:uncharacterized protein [Centruroides vittatus]|uniref:uncharacterized protein n=1 Tax=Centruroides vittatus TaxID=120091 RepID=UPI00350ED17D